MKTLDQVFKTPQEEMVEEITEIELEDINVVSNGTKLDIDSDYMLAREKIITSIIRSAEVLDEAVKEVKMSASPRNIEAASSIVKNLNDSTLTLLSLHDKFRDIEHVAEIETDDSVGIKTSLTEILNQIENKSKLTTTTT